MVKQSFMGVYPEVVHLAGGFRSLPDYVPDSVKARFRPLTSIFGIR